MAHFPNFDMLVISEVPETLTDGTTYPAQIRKLGLGAPELNQSWLHFPPSSRWNGTLLSSSMFAQGLTSSVSYGMHIGSPALGIPGSLTIGGYDKIEGLVLYIYLPKSTCDAIISLLPVTYQKKYGLYFWDVGDPRYNLIVSSRAFLSFTFRLNSGISQNFTINVPFALLNLTLTHQ
ncbi:hypothetical protein BKA61DRAFT_697934 [Leptodontidium sp. MPI-SDFR-AT-0119]|nr:hypothetical protein BKA61DRAFT_697934 [Leptodontidium sp. MPI-SDFR-AT-0119]